MDKVFLELRAAAFGGGEVAKEALLLSSRLQSFLESECIFSLNEELNDLSDDTIKYLTIPFLHSLLVTRKPTSNSQKRLQILNEAQQACDSFISLITYYGFDVPKLNPVDRASKIQIVSLLDKVEYACTAIENVQKDSESYRQVSIDFVIYCILRSLNEKLYIQRETDLLKQRDSETLKNQISSVHDHHKFRPFVLGSRQDLKRQVFKPGHSLPTLTIEEFYEQAYGSGIYKALSIQNSANKTDEDSDNDVYIQRQKDAYNDDNPRGSGNRINRS